jgi:hypothetical protein
MKILSFVLGQTASKLAKQFMNKNFKNTFMNKIRKI